MSKHIPTYEGLAKVADAERPTFLRKLAYWFREFLENAE